MPLIEGHVLENRYRIEELLGKGGMGAVYRAADQRFRAPVAIKENHLDTPASQKQFTREAELLNRLRHPNLPRVIDHFSVPGQGQYLVMDYVEGDDLNQVIARQGALPEAQALNWIGQVLDALAYLHSQGIIHRDVKPANVKITPDGRVYLVDFGLAKVYDPSQRTTMGARGVTPGYAPPEQYGMGRTDARADVYSTGATLYALLTGDAPPDAMDFVTGDAQLVSPRLLSPGLSLAVEAGILRAMQLRPTDRFQTVSEFQAALSQPVTAPPPAPVPPGQNAQLATPPAPPLAATVYASQPEAAVHPPGSAPPGSDPGPPSSKRRKRRPAWLWLLIAALVCCLAILAIAAVALTSGWDPLSGAAPAQPTVVIALPTATQRPAATKRSEPTRPPEEPAPPEEPVERPPPVLLDPPGEGMPRLHGEVEFRWDYDGDVSPEQGWQLLIWHVEAPGPEPAGEPVRGRQHVANLDELPHLREHVPGEYLWSVQLVDRRNREPLGPVAEPRGFVYAGPGDEGRREDGYPPPIPIHPPPGVEVEGGMTFAWEWPHPPPAEGHVFDLRIWAVPHQQDLPMEAKPHTVEGTRATEIEVDLRRMPAIREHGPGEYAWAVVVSHIPCNGCDPEVIGEFSEPRPFHYLEP